MLCGGSQVTLICCCCCCCCCWENCLQQQRHSASTYLEQMFNGFSVKTFTCWRQKSNDCPIRRQIRVSTGEEPWFQAGTQEGELEKRYHWSGCLVLGVVLPNFCPNYWCLPFCASSWANAIMLTIVDAKIAACITNRWDICGGVLWLCFLFLQIVASNEGGIVDIGSKTDFNRGSI